MHCDVRRECKIIRICLCLVKLRLMDKYKSVPDKVIMLAMDSVDYDEERAMHILDIMVAEEATQTPRTSSGHRYPHA